MKQREKPTTGTCNRRSKRATKRPEKYMFTSSGDSPTGKVSSAIQNGSLIRKNRSGIKRKVCAKQAERNYSHDDCFKESPFNALSDALYSEASSELSGSRQNTQPPSSLTEKTVRKKS